jgi:hypothetical protein
MSVAVSFDLPRERGAVRTHSWQIRALASAVLIFATLFYLQFGAQAILQSAPQAALTFLGAIGLGWGAFRLARGERAAGTVWLATMPLFVFQIVGTFLIPDESPIFIVGASIAPVLAGMVWLVRRPRKSSAVPSQTA